MVLLIILSLFSFLQESAEMSPEVPTTKLVVNEEFLPFKDNSLDLVVSSLRYVVIKKK